MQIGIMAAPPRNPTPHVLYQNSEMKFRVYVMQIALSVAKLPQTSENACMLQMLCNFHCL